MGKKLIRFNRDIKTLLRNKANFVMSEGFLSCSAIACSLIAKQPAFFVFNAPTA